MKILIAGASGMIGSLLIKQCLDSPQINEVISLVRRNSQLTHDKLTEVIIEDFENYAGYDHLFQNIDAAHFCIGVYTGQVDEALFKKITLDYAVAFAKALKKNSPLANLCLLSGAGADRTEKRRSVFGRYKGMAENQIDAMDLAFYTFRPGYIYPVTPRKEPNVIYTLTRLLYPLIKLLGEKASIKSTELASAMFNVGINGADKQILENKDILTYT